MPWRCRLDLYKWQHKLHRYASLWLQAFLSRKNVAAMSYSWKKNIMYIITFCQHKIHIFWDIMQQHCVECFLMSGICTLLQNMTSLHSFISLNGFILRNKLVRPHILHFHSMCMLTHTQIYVFMPCIHSESTSNRMWNIS